MLRAVRNESDTESAYAFGNECLQGSVSLFCCGYQLKKTLSLCTPRTADRAKTVLNSVSR